MNLTTSSTLLALVCAAILSVGCAGSDTTGDTATPAAEADQDPIANEGFESGETELGSEQPSESEEDDGETEQDS